MLDLVTSRSSWLHHARFGYITLGLVTSRSIWLHHARFGYITLDFVTSRSFWLHHARFGYITLDLVTSRSIWLHHARFGYITLDLVTSRSIWLENPLAALLLLPMAQTMTGISHTVSISSCVACSPIKSLTRDSELADGPSATQYGGSRAATVASAARVRGLLSAHHQRVAQRGKHLRPPFSPLSQRCPPESAGPQEQLV
jgi:hypothetical protein